MDDVIVVGGGPVGSYTAYLLADSGLQVSLFEEDGEVGENVVCTGIIGKASFERLDLPRKTILSQIKSVVFFSPALIPLNLAFPNTIAYVVDRNAFDKELLRRAKGKGVDIKLGRRVEKLKVCKDFVEVETFGEDLPGKQKAKVIVLATGNSYKLQKNVGLAGVYNFLHGAQIEVEMRGLTQTEIYLGNRISPGSFAWAVPIGDSRARMGILVKSKARFYLERFLEERHKRRLKERRSGILQRRVANGPARKNVKDRVMVVGEAAGQVKTTTGGGIAYGLLCSEIAAQVLKRAFGKGDLSERGLYEYEKIWKEKLEGELKMGCLARRFFEKLGDKYIDRIFGFLQKSKGIMKVVQENFDFDYHSNLLSFGINLIRKIL